MLIDFKKAVAKHRMQIKGVLQIGCHHGQEHDTFVEIGAQNFVYVEPCEPAFSILHDRFWQDADKITLVKAACADYDGMATMYTETANKGMSNSLLRPAKHVDYYPDIKFGGTAEVGVLRLDSIEFDRSKYNLLVLDCQGAEGLIIKGAAGTLAHIDYIYTEINTGQLYEGCTEVEELDRLLSDFVRIETKMTNAQWGDALYKRIGL